MEPVNYKYCDRHYQYRDEPEPFRALPMTIKGLGEYFRKLVDFEGGWLHLRGRAPEDALRHSSNGRPSRTDFRMIKTAVGELLRVGYLELGTLDQDGVFIPLESGDYLGIRDWIPSQRGMSRQETRDWYAEREERGARYLAQFMPAAVAATAGTESPETAALPVGMPPSQDAATSSRRSEAAPKAPRQGPTVHRQRTDRSPSAGDSNGTELAVFHSIPFHKPPLSPKGESAYADRRACSGSGRSDSKPPARNQEAVDTLARQAVEWVNQQHSPPAGFKADSKDTRRRVKAWLEKGWNWLTVRAALELRLSSQKATHPDSWSNWVTPHTFFNPKLGHFVEQAEAGHRYRVGGAASDDAERAARRARRQIEDARTERHRDAERAFADVLEVVDLVGTDGDWVSELPHSTARSTVRDLGWRRVVQEREAIREAFIQRFVGGPRRDAKNAAA